MFGIFTDVAENALDMLDGMIEGEMPTKHQLAKAIDAGATIISVSLATGVAVDVLEKILDE